VLVRYSRGAKEPEAVVAEIRNGGRADEVSADLSVSDGAHTFAKPLRGIVGDRLDILVANAGVSKSARIEERRSKPSSASLPSISYVRISKISPAV
jgi:NAD(P)-dependent dehydrogenase (short-subunit alcohol dehydrogenase family)